MLLEESLQQALLAGVLAAEQRLPALRQERAVHVRVRLAGRGRLVLGEVSGQITGERAAEPGRQGRRLGSGHPEGYPCRRFTVMLTVLTKVYIPVASTIMARLPGRPGMCLAA